MRRFGLAFSLLLAATLSIATVNSFHVNGRVFQKLKEEHNAFMTSMLSPATSPVHESSGPLQAARTSSEAGTTTGSMAAARSSLFPCVPCMVTSLYSYMDSFSVSTKLMATTNGDAGDSSSLKPSQPRKLLRDLTLAVWKVVTFPMRLMYNLLGKLISKRSKEEDQPKDEETITAEDTTNDDVVLQVNGGPSPAAVSAQTATVAAPYAATTTTTAETVTAAEPVVVVAAPAPPSTQVSKPRAYPLPKGDRWAVSAPKVDLSGDWAMIVSEEFKKEYDAYLLRLGQPLIVRTIAVGIIGLTTEYTEQRDNGREVFIRGTNARGVWERSLVATGADSNSEEYEAKVVPIVTADDEKVLVESWWEENGTVHVSWMRGVEKYGGGDFESRRYLEKNGKVLVCESAFMPTEEGREPVKITWRFHRKGEKVPP